MEKIVLSLIGLLLFSAERISAQDNDIVCPTMDGVETIHINNTEPNPNNNQLWIPDIASDMSFTLFKLPQGLNSGYVQRVYIDSDYIVVKCIQNVLCYSKSGDLLNNIGTIDIPRETGGVFHLRPAAIFIDTYKKEICVSYCLRELEEYHNLCFYDYSGKLIRKESNLPFRYMDFVITDNAICTYNGSYHELRNPDNLEDRYYNELSVVSNGRTRRFIPSILAKDQESYGMTFNFSDLKDSFTFHFIYSNTIYSIDRKTSDVKAKYRIDFGENGFPDFSKMSSSEVSSFIKEKSRGKIGLVQNVLENGKYLVFSYYMNGPMVQSIVIYDKASKRILYHGPLVSNSKITSHSSNPQLIGIDGENLYFELSIDESNPVLPSAEEVLGKDNYAMLLKNKDDFVVMSVKLK